MGTSCKEGVVQPLDCQFYFGEALVDMKHFGEALEKLWWIWGRRGVKQERERRKRERKELQLDP